MLHKCCWNASGMLLKCSSIIMLLYVVCKPMDIHGYTDIRWIWICCAIHAHGYFCRRGTVRLMDLDLDLVLQYPSKPAPLASACQLRRVVLGQNNLIVKCVQEAREPLSSRAQACLQARGPSSSSLMGSKYKTSSSWAYLHSLELGSLTALILHYPWSLILLVSHLWGYIYITLDYSLL
jgi:hypothetical protein